jgi:hypothetical protein
MAEFILRKALQGAVTASLGKPGSSAATAPSFIWVLATERKSRQVTLL